MTVTTIPTPTPTTTQGATAAAGTAITGLGGNYKDFLKLLMTQLQNQNPTAPMDTNQFTSQLVQFASVEQQINTNSSLTQLIQATQSGTLLQSSSLVGKTVQVTGDSVSLQNGKAGIDFTTAAPQTVNIAIATPDGVQVSTATVTSTAGPNTWTWNGKDTNGKTLPDGVYKAVVTGTDNAPVPFTVLGTATGVERSGTALKVNLGALQLDMAAVQSVSSH